MRMGEILNLKWTDVDLFRKAMVVLKTKNMEPRTIPMTQTVVDLLLTKSKVVTMSGYIFATSSGKKLGPRNLQREWYNALDKAKIKNFRFHDLRHTFATRLVQSGIDVYAVAKLMGHKDLTSTQRYAHHSTESLRDSVRVLDRYEKRVEKVKAKS